MGLPSWQSSPATPGGQRQAPVAESQVPPFWQRQARLQFFPKVLAGQAGAREDGEAQPAAPAVHSRCIEYPRAGTRRAFSPTALQRDSLWLQRMPVQPAGQSQAVSSALHVAPFWQSSQVRLQSGPNVCSRQTATRGAAGEKPSPRLLQHLTELGQRNSLCAAAAELNGSVL